MDVRQVILCHECKHCECIPIKSFGGETVTEMHVCNLRQLSRHITDRNGWCYLAQRREDE